MRTPTLLVSLSLLAVIVAPASRADLSQPGEFFAGRSTVTVTRANGSTFSAILFYPATAQGPGAAFDPAGAPYPAVSFGHGFLQGVAQYQSTLEHLATRGYLVIASESESGLSPNHANFASDLSRCLTWLEEQNADAQSFLFGAVDTGAFGMSGHSMGGGASILATAQDARVRALANLAAANTNPSAVSAIASVTVPSRLIAGDRDTITPVKQHGQLMYNNATTPKQLPLIVGGFHCGFTDSTFLFCDSGTISRAEQLAITRRLLTEFFDLHLKGDQTRWVSVWGPGATSQSDTTMSLDARASISPGAQAVDVAPGGAATVTMSLGAVAGGAGAYTLVLESAAGADATGWTATTLASNISLGAGQMADFDVLLGAPKGAADGQTVEWIVSARRDDDGATRAWARIAATVSANAPCPGDANGDGLVNFTDLNVVLGSFGQTGAPGAPGAIPGDINADGVVNFADLNEVLANFGAACR